jgi:hypothetical protein
MSDLKARIAKLEKQRQAAGQPDILTPKFINYRTGLVPGIAEPAGVIGLRLIDYTEKDSAQNDPERSNHPAA